ncbi:MAG: TIGR02587 family membrane protein, partial [Blastocatellia bacterium]
LTVGLLTRRTHSQTAVMRGVSGAFLFGAPFLYTMEVWWKGAFTSPPRMLVTLGVAYAMLVALNFGGGFRAKQPRTWARIFADSAEALAIALLTATLSLILLRVVRSDSGLGANLGRIIVEALPLSIGVGIANHVLRKRDEENGEDGGADDPLEHQWHDHAWHGTLADAGATALGAVIIASAIAPTDEIPMIASALSTPRLLGVITASILLSYLIVFEADFGPQQARRSQPGIFQSPISETLISYLISLLVSLLMLWLFQLVRIGDPLSQWVGYTVVLGLPATIGGAAGRLVI